VKHYNYSRDYDPQIGRYVQSDPVGLFGGLNTYGYAYANPVSFSDPDGRNPAAAARAGWVMGRVASIALERALLVATGTTLGGLIYEMCNESGEEARCKAVERGCKEGCTGVFEDDPDKLPGAGSQYQSRWRRCVRECMQSQNCFNF
jgi:hypothetical protein